MKAEKVPRLSSPAKLRTAPAPMTSSERSPAVVHRQLEGLHQVLRNASACAARRRAGQPLRPPPCAADVRAEASAIDLLAAAEGAHQRLGRHLVLHDAVDAARPPCGCDRCPRPSARACRCGCKTTSGSMSSDQQRQRPVQDEQGRS